MVYRWRAWALVKYLKQESLRYKDQDSVFNLLKKYTSLTMNEKAPFDRNLQECLSDKNPERALVQMAVKRAIELKYLPDEQN